MTGPVGEDHADAERCPPRPAVLLSGIVVALVYLSIVWLWYAMVSWGYVAASDGAPASLQTVLRTVAAYGVGAAVGLLPVALIAKGRGGAAADVRFTLLCAFLLCTGGPALVLWGYVS